MEMGNVSKGQQPNHRADNMYISLYDGTVGRPKRVLELTHRHRKSQEVQAKI